MANNQWKKAASEALAIGDKMSAIADSNNSLNIPISTKTLKTLETFAVWRKVKRNVVIEEALSLYILLIPYMADVRDDVPTDKDVLTAIELMIKCHNERLLNNQNHSEPG